MGKRGYLNKIHRLNLDIHFFFSLEKVETRTLIGFIVNLCLNLNLVLCVLYIKGPSQTRPIPLNF